MIIILIREGQRVCFRFPFVLLFNSRRCVVKGGFSLSLVFRSVFLYLSFAACYFQKSDPRVLMNARSSDNLKESFMRDSSPLSPQSLRPLVYIHLYVGEATVPSPFHYLPFLVCLCLLLCVHRYNTE